jgi:hypothetical protein
MNGLLRKGCVAAGAVIALAAAPAASARLTAGSTTTSSSATSTSTSATTTTAASTCPSYPLSQPFLRWGDSNEYVLLSGETFDNVTGSGWQLLDGARLVSTRLQDGRTGQVLDMPAGSAVLTPPLCVDGSSFPTARTMIAGLTGTQGISVAVSYQTLSGAWPTPVTLGTVTGTGSGWSPSGSIALNSQGLTGDHLLRIALAAKTGEYELYNFYVDPRRSH